MRKVETGSQIHYEFYSLLYCTLSRKLFLVPHNCNPLCWITVLDRRRAEGDISHSLNFLLFMMPFSVRPSRWAEGFWQFYLHDNLARRSLDFQSFWYLSLGMPISAIIRNLAHLEIKVFPTKGPLPPTIIKSRRALLLGAYPVEQNVANTTYESHI